MKRREALKWSVWAAGISSLPISMATIQSCKPTGDPGWTPSFLSPEEAQIITNVAEIILPLDQGAPGAIEVHCPEFVDLMARDCLSTTEQRQFREGLEIMNDECQKSVNVSISAGISDDVQRYVTDLDHKSFNGQDSPVNQTFRWLKQMVVLGYFTSEIVMRNQLNYHAIPGEYLGCIEINKEAKAYVDDNVVG